MAGLLTLRCRHLIIVGNGKVLAGNQTWKTILSQIEVHPCLLHLLLHTTPLV
jgi:hypothetical protein